jgi:hypothetical protein
MKKLTMLSAGLAAALAVSGLGCSHNEPAPAAPNSVSGKAGTTTTGIDATGNPAPGTATGDPAGRAADPATPPGQTEQPPTANPSTVTPTPQPAPPQSPDNGRQQQTPR